MPQIRVSETVYHELKERARGERRTLSAVIEVLLADTTPTGEGESPPAESLAPAPKKGKASVSTEEYADGSPLGKTIERRKA